MKIKFSTIKKTEDLIKLISPIFDIQSGESINIEIDFVADSIKAEYLAIVVAAIRHARERGINIEVSVIKPNNGKGKNHKICEIKHKNMVKYSENMNFYELLNIKGNSRLKINSSNNSSKYGIRLLKDGQESDIVEDIIKILREEYRLEESLYSSINYCLWEQIDNIGNHAECGESKFVVVENSPETNEITICVIDTGVGIYSAFKSSANNATRFFTPKEAVTKCVEENVTNGRGKGNGLYHNKKFIEENQGSMYIYSGRYGVEINSDKLQAFRINNWQGTIIIQKISTNRKIDFKKVFGSNIPVSVKECNDMIDKLW